MALRDTHGICQLCHRLLPLVAWGERLVPTFSALRIRQFKLRIRGAFCASCAVGSSEVIYGQARQQTGDRKNLRTADEVGGKLVRKITDTPHKLLASVASRSAARLYRTKHRSESPCTICYHTTNQHCENCGRPACDACSHMVHPDVEWTDGRYANLYRACLECETCFLPVDSPAYLIGRRSVRKFTDGLSIHK